MTQGGERRPSYCRKMRREGLLWGHSSNAQNNNEWASSVLLLGASGTACSRAWHELYGKSFGCGGPHAYGSGNCLVSAVPTRRGVVKFSPPMRRDGLPLT